MGVRRRAGWQAARGIAMTLLVLASGGCASPSGGSCDACTSGDPSAVEMPYYFFSVHVDPIRNDSLVPALFQRLVGMVDHANAHDVKLTLMFSALMARRIASNPDKLALVRQWQQQGHEIAGHHHDINHCGEWDGYTDFTEEEAISAREVIGEYPPAPGDAPEDYIGPLSGFVADVRLLDPTLDSGVCSEWVNKGAVPDEILYSTASGYLHYGTPGILAESVGLSANDAELSRNEFVIAATLNGVEHTWLGNSAITDIAGVEAVAESMTSGAVGVVVHNSETEAALLEQLIDFYCAKDQDGTRSKTVKQIIEGGLLPVQQVDLAWDRAAFLERMATDGAGMCLRGP